MARRALVTGIGGQDGSLLAELLLRHGYELFGSAASSPEGLEEVQLVELDLEEPSSVASVLRETGPHEVYHLASVSFVPAWWEDPTATTRGATVGVATLLEGIRRERPQAHVFYAASSEMFGEAEESPQDEGTPVSPRTPYGAAKAFGFFLTRSFRARYGLHASSGILFNHESPRRPEHFVFRKVTRGAAAISLGLEHELTLGNLDARRDWGYAGDYVRAMWLILQADQPDDYVIATGEAHTVRELVEAAFAEVGLDWRNHVIADESLGRGAVETLAMLGDPSKARERLGWRPEVTFGELVRLMVEADVAALQGAARR